MKKLTKKNLFNKINFEKNKIIEVFTFGPTAVKAVNV